MQRRSRPIRTAEGEQEGSGMWIILILLALLFVSQNPGVVPLPPKPDPVVTTGSKIVILVHETGEQTSELNRTILDLRQGEANTYLKNKGHMFYNLDVNQKDATGKLLPILEMLKPFIGTKPIPVLCISDKVDGNKAGKPTYCESLPAGTSANTVIEIIKRNGG